MALRILIIEDNSANQELMRYLLEAFGHQVTIAADGEAGWEQAQVDRPQLILCDVQLPRLDGYEVLRRLKANPTLKEIPVIAVTALAMVGDRDALLAAGFDGYISKPIEPQSFVSEVESFLCGSAQKRILIVDDRVTNRQLLVSLLSYGGHHLTEAADGTEALEQARRLRPDLIITDILMPRMDGFQFVQALRADPAIASTQVIFYTATYRQHEADILARACGVSVVIPKPSEPRVILEHVNRMLGVPPAKSPPAPPPAAMASSPRALEGKLADHLSVLRELSRQLTQATDSAEAVLAERNQLQALSGRLVQSLQNLESIGFRLSALLDLGVEVGRQRDPVRLLEIFCGAARNILGVQLAAVGLVSPEGRTERFIERKSPEHSGSFSLEAETPLLLQAISSRTVVRADQRLVVPLISHLEPLGWIFVSRAPGAASFSADEEEMLQTIAAQLAVAFDNLRLYDVVQRHAAHLELEVADRKRAHEALAVANQQLEVRVSQRTLELQQANEELEAFSYSVSHDLRAPLRSINTYAEMFVEDHGTALPPSARQYLDRIREGSRRMSELIEGLLAVAGVGRREITRTSVDLSALARQVVEDLRRMQSSRPMEISIEAGLEATGDPRLLRVVWENLLSNAWKFTANTALPRIEVGRTNTPNGPAFFVRDNGAGFDMQYAGKLFSPFQRLHRQDDYAGTGVGLATVRRIVLRHRGQIWAEAKPNEGATFYFTLSGD